MGQGLASIIAIYISDTDSFIHVIKIICPVVGHFKAAYSVTMNIFRKKNYFLLKAFVKVELSYVFTIKMFSTAENCMEK